MTESTTFKSVDEYIASQPEASRVALELVRKTIVTSLPGADEVISYNMPTYKLRGKTVLQFAAWTGHYALYGSSDKIVQALGDKLRGYKIAKGTIRFPLDETVPEELIARIAKLRAETIAP